VRFPSATHLVVLCTSRAHAEEAQRRVVAILAPLGLQLHPDKTRIVCLIRGQQGFDFLGFHHHKVESWRWRNHYYLNRWPAIPIFGDGKHLQQPVYVGDVAAAVVRSLESESTIGQTYNISGAAPVTYNQIIDTVCRLMGRKVHKIHIPAAPVVAGLAALERLSVRLPIKAEQIKRLNEHKAFDYQDAARDFGYQPSSLAEGIRQELKELGMPMDSRVLSQRPTKAEA